MNNMKLTFAAKSENESFARSVVAAFFAQLPEPMGTGHFLHTVPPN